ncbi:hypothetical protein SDC9_135044 [bioreactor metagenome]|uniref:Uncharacterized protein n=1 Tax=bioreactor metagenome TaxID=1076179 RepID=A0A645DGJ5_9ZZZZ
MGSPATLNDAMLNVPEFESVVSSDAYVITEHPKHKTIANNNPMTLFIKIPFFTTNIYYALSLQNKLGLECQVLSHDQESLSLTFFQKPDADQ